MTETQTLLDKIATLRQRMAQAQGLAQEGTTAAVALAAENPGPLGHLLDFERQVVAGTEQDLELADLVCGMAPSEPADSRPLPRQLTSRARRLLEHGQELLGKLKALSEVFPSTPAHQLGAELVLERDDPLSRFYRETSSMIDAALRTVPLFPDNASTQLTLCEGLEAMMKVIATRIRTLEAAVERQRGENARIDRLARLLTALETGQAVEIAAFLALAEEILDDVENCGPLRFLEADPRQPARFIAAHSLTVARVVARVARHEPELRSRPLEPLLAALIHDAGMLRVPAALLAKTEPLDDDDRRAIEAHCPIGAQLAAQLLPDAAWLSEAAAGHHERLDGTGYPGGLNEFQLSTLTRLLAVCDVYTALCTARPQRPALETRTAMADTLLLADRGLLDRHHAERLLQLSFYPVGSVVELASGAIGVVAATPGTRRDFNYPARPVVAVILDENDVPLPAPRHLDLAQCTHQSIVRSLSRAERHEVLGTRLPEWL
jgi:HD-GYP domain-containing protein (c-di-GMP phosphodiesterase class II)